MDLREVKDKHFTRDVVMLLLLIMISPQALVFGNNKFHFFITFTNLFSIIATFYFFQIKSSKYVSHTNNTIMVVMLLSMCITGLVYFELSLEYIVRLFYGIAAIYYVRKISFKRFIDAYIWVMKFLAIWSIFTVLMGALANEIINKFPIVSTFQGWDYYCTGFANYPTFAWRSFRLMGPFREPGVTQIFFNLAITFYLFFNNKIKWITIGVFVLAIVLTFSTTGYFVLAINFGYYWLKRQKESSTMSTVVILIFSLLIVGSILTYTSYSLEDSMVFSKFYEEDNDSVTSRFGSIVANCELLKLNPILGNGIVTVENLFSKLSYYKGITSEHNTNTILVQFATFGIVYGTLFVALIWRFSKIISFSIISRVLVFFMFCLSLSGEDITRCLMLYIILCYGADYKQQIKISYD